MVRREPGPDPGPRPGGAAGPAGADPGSGPSDPGILDFHNHLLPGVDDGATDADESRAALAELKDEGVATLIVTPHFEAELQLRPPDLEARLAELDAAWSRFRPLAADAGVSAHRGVELRLDLAHPDLSDPRLRLAGGPFVLCEFAWFTIPPRSERVLATIRGDGWVPVVAHPERYEGMDDDLELTGRWIAAGAFLQLNGGSLLGRFGERAKRTAVTLLELGRAHYVCSDYHARGSPRVREYTAELARIAGAGAALRLTRTNPGRLLRGEAPLDGEGREPGSAEGA
jgi:protein-tyrosine phosphatase